MPSESSELEIVCSVEGSIILKAMLEFGTEDELRHLFDAENIRSKIATLLNDVLASGTTALERSRHNSIGWVDDNREASFTEVIDGHVAVKHIDIYPA